ncbi:MAG: DUF2071 domain-containing protein [Planctomycetota bacterium]
MSDRTWPLPARKYSLRMNWHDLLFMHWPVEAADVQRLLPDGLSVDTRDGQAWIGVVPFHMSDVAPRCVPAVPWVSKFPELNVRTYVTVNDKPGVWFFSLDATNPLAVRVARRFFHLPYTDANISIAPNGDGFDYASERTHRGEPSAELVMTYRPTSKPFFAEAGTLEHWLTARYCLYAADRSGNLLKGEIDHPPWPLQHAEAVTKCNTMLEWLNLKPQSAEPHLLFSQLVKVQAWSNDRVAKVDRVAKAGSEIAAV